MPVATRDETLELLQKSGLLEEDRLQRFMSEQLADAADGAVMLKRLVDAGALSSWQAERLEEGKWRGFYLGKYRLITPLGSGAMGSVYLAEHRVMRHRVAIKVLAKRLTSKPSNIARFEREARAAAVLNHPNVVRAYDIDRHDDNTPYLVMEYVEGLDLQKLVLQHENKALDARTAADYIRQVALGLHEAHKAGLIHRDIKPSNLLLDKSGLVKVLDLGLARIVDDDVPSLTIMNDSKLIGTVDYLAPEQAVNSHQIDGRADLYALGCSLYFLITGSPPFPTGTLPERILKHQSRRPRDMRKRCAERGIPEPPDAIVEICDKMMAKSAAKRHATAGDVATDLKAFLDGNYQRAVVSHASDENLSLDDDASTRSSGRGHSSSEMKRDTVAAKSGTQPVSGSASARKVVPSSNGDDLVLADDSQIGASKTGDTKPSSKTGDSKPANASQTSTGNRPTPATAAKGRAPSSVPERNVPSSNVAAIAAAASVDVLDAAMPASASPSFGGSLADVFDDVVGKAGASASGSSGPLGNALVSDSSRSLTLGPASAPAKTEQSDALAKYRDQNQGDSGSGDFNYPLWFLVGAGLLLGGIMIWIFASGAEASRSNVDQEKIEGRNLEE
jgi:serine/threonine protein kinase